MSWCRMEEESDDGRVKSLQLGTWKWWGGMHNALYANESGVIVARVDGGALGAWA